MKNKILMFILKYVIPLIGITMLFDLDSNKYSSIPVLFVLFGLYSLYKFCSTFKISKRQKNVFTVLAIIYSMFIVFGKNIDSNYMNYNYSFLNDWFKILVELYSISVVAYYVNVFIYNKIQLLPKTDNVSNKKKILIAFSIMIAIWGIYFINFYPGLMSPDSLNQWGQASGKIVLSNHHPIAHTLFIKIFYTIGNHFNNANLGVALYSLAQMSILAGTFAYILNYFYKRNCNKYLIYVFVAYYAFVPIFGFYSVTMWKDVLFGAFSTILMLQIYKYIEEDSFSLIDKVVLMLSIILTCLFRTNGLYAVLVLDIIIIYVFRKKMKQVLLLFAVPTLCAYIIVSPVYSACGIKKTEFTENIGIFIRQIYGTIYSGRHIDSKSINYLEKLVDTDEALEAYTPYDDHIKSVHSYDNEFLEKNKGEFLLTWAKIGIHHPVIYSELYLKSTYGFWYPEAQGYLVHRWPTAENMYEIQSTDFNKVNVNGYFEKSYDMPVIKYLLSDAFCLWILLFNMAIKIINKKYKYIIPMLLPFFVWGTIVIATPLSYQPRYTFMLYCAVSMIIIIGLNSIKRNEKI